MDNQTEVKASSLLLELDIRILLRAWAILCVVMFHAGVDYLAGGAALLLLLSGYNYARYRLKKQFSGHALYFIPPLIIKVLIPFWAYMIVFSFIKGRPVDINNLLLIGNNIEGTVLNFPFGIWFIHALVQSLLFFSLPLLITSVKTWASKNPILYVYGIFIFACLIRFLDEYFGWGASNHLQGKQFTWVFWLFALGCCIAYADKKAHKIIFSILLLIFPAVFYYEDWPRVLAVAIGGMLALWGGTIILPKLLMWPIEKMRTSSLFIYMLHPRAPINSPTSGWDIDVLRIVIGVTLGIVGHYLYNQVIKVLGFVFRKVKKDDV